MPAASPVTVLLAVRNGMPHLPEAIDSILGQTHRRLELLVIDDGSTDGTSDYLRTLGDTRVRVLRSDAAGLVAALNYGLAEARHEIIARMDADDVSHASRLTVQLEHLEANPSLVAVGCCYTIVDEAGRPLVEQHVPCLPTYAERQLYFRDAFAHASMTFRRASVLDVGGYRDIGPCEDYDLWLRLLARGEVAGVCAPPLFTYRRVASGVSLSKATLQDQCRRATREAAMRDRPLQVPSPLRIAEEGKQHVRRSTSCRAPGVAYAFDHLALARVLYGQRRYRASARCAVGLLLFALRQPSSFLALPPMSWLAYRSAHTPRTAEQTAVASIGRRRARRPLHDA